MTVRLSQYYGIVIKSERIYSAIPAWLAVSNHIIRFIRFIQFVLDVVLYSFVASYLYVLMLPFVES